MHRIFRVKAYEAEHGPHFNEEHARNPVPAYLTCNPFGCQGGLNDYGYGYGYGYNNGCGCGC
jgi:hypothetical protein